MSGDYARKLAETSLSIGSIKLQPDAPFLWASGYYMPIYNDNRMLLGGPEHRRLVVEGFRALMEARKIDCDVVAGTATAGIPHATSLADSLGKPLVYVRSSSKGHGLENRIEGVADGRELAGKRVILVEDLISTGGSSISAVEALRDTGAQLPVCLAIFSYGLEKAQRAFAELEPSCTPVPILEYDRLVEIAFESGYIEEVKREALLEWRRDPFGWGETHGFPPQKK